MRRISFAVALVFLAVSAVIAQETGEGSGMSVPVATHSQAACTGFIADPALPRDLFVLGGADDDFHSVVRQFVQGESIFISHHNNGENPSVGVQYRVIRPAHDLFQTMHYADERRDLRRMGTPYEDVAEVTVSHVNPDGVVAKVNFSCEPIVPGDTLVAYQPRPIPEYTLSPPLDHFAPLDNNRKHGEIAASRNNIGYFGAQTVVYLNLGEADGAKPGARFRIYKVLPAHNTGFLAREKTPTEIVGEAVVLSVQSKSSVAMVVSSYREISAGDYVEAE